MKIDVQNYKGIKFVRISSLPEDQKEVFWDSFNTQKIIKILRGNELLNDCLRYDDYQDWYQQRFKSTLPGEPARAVAKELRLVFK